MTAKRTASGGVLLTLVRLLLSIQMTFVTELQGLLTRLHEEQRVRRSAEFYPMCRVTSTSSSLRCHTCRQCRRRCRHCRRRTRRLLTRQSRARRRSSCTRTTSTCALSLCSTVSCHTKAEGSNGLRLIVSCMAMAPCLLMLQAAPLEWPTSGERCQQSKLPSLLVASAAAIRHNWRTRARWCVRRLVRAQVTSRELLEFLEGSDDDDRDRRKRRRRKPRMWRSVRERASWKSDMRQVMCCITRLRPRARDPTMKPRCSFLEPTMSFVVIRQPTAPHSWSEC